MVNQNELLEEISRKDFDIDKYVNLVIIDEGIRYFIINSMITNPMIMKYYHCFYIISDASEKKPELFYKYWSEFTQLLHHSNSYHRDFGLILLANLAIIDTENRLNLMIDDYLKLMADEKFMTAEVCVKNCAKIASVKPELVNSIIDYLINFEDTSVYPDKQKALMMSNIIESLEKIYDIHQDKFLSKIKLLEFAKRQLISISPKTKKTARNIILKYSK